MAFFAVLPGQGAADFNAISRNWSAGVPENGVLAYEVRLKGKRVGFQYFTFENLEDGALKVDITINLNIKFGFIPVFRYAHRNTEIWRDGLLSSVVSKTDNNGEDVFVDLATANGVIKGAASNFENNLLQPLLSTSYFNPNFIHQNKLLSSQDGRLLNVSVDYIGEEWVPVEYGQTQAHHFRLDGDLKIDIWYTEAGRWVRTEFDSKAGRAEIRPISPEFLPPRRKWRMP
ncbi:MAG: DUF6134 family protein [Parvibaculales bacterium]